MLEKLKIINYMSNKVIEGLNNDYDIERRLNNFLKENISIDLKKETVEKLYKLQLYKNGYLGPDPRGVRRSFIDALKVLDSKKDSEIRQSLETLKMYVGILKDKENNPYESTLKRVLDNKNQIENKIRY